MFKRHNPERLTFFELKKVTVMKQKILQGKKQQFYH